MAISHLLSLFCKKKAKSKPESKSTIPNSISKPPFFSSKEVPTSTSLSSCTEQELDQSALNAPCDYIRSLPSKNVRKILIDSFNIWFQLPDDLTSTVVQVINDLHNSSLILDDIQDDSSLRRGNPATHCVFGNSQSINSATYMLMSTCLTIQNTQTNNPRIMDVFLNEALVLFIGQSWDLKWRFHIHCPSVQEYMGMIDGKTGAMFRLLARLMHCMSQSDLPVEKSDTFTTLLGRFYQVRDDYQNLRDATYTKQKGFCEDLDEGKFSYPIIACCESDSTARDIILGIFRRHAIEGGSLSKETKTYILGLIKGSGAFQMTWELLQNLKKETQEALLDLEEFTGTHNPALRLILAKLGNIESVECS